MGPLSSLLIAPLVGLVAGALLPAGQTRWFRILMFGVLVVQIGLLGLWVLPQFWAQQAAGQASALPQFFLQERLPWLHLSVGEGRVLAVDYFLGVDTVALSLIGLSFLLLAIATAASGHITERVKAYFMLLLLLDVALVGSFAALDLLLFYIFFEFMLFPMYFLIGGWGGERRQYAAIKFFVYTLAGSVFLLLVLVAFALSINDPVASLEALKSGLLQPEPGIKPVAHSLSYTALIDPANLLTDGPLALGTDQRVYAFWLSFLAFAIKLPAVPVHTWLPDAHVEAATPISVLLAGILLKVGGFGLLRFCAGLFPAEVSTFAVALSLIAVVSILYGGLNALAQQDLKRMIAYSSVSHMGYVLLGIASQTPQGYTGAALQMINHGLVSAMLFLLAGVLYERVHNRMIDAFRGLWVRMPVYTTFTVIAFFAALGLPGLNTFVSEFLAVGGGFTAASQGRLPYWVAVGAVVGIVISAAYFLRAFQRMFFGEYAVQGGDEWTPKLTDLTWQEWLYLLPLAVGIVLLGVYPAWLSDALSVSLQPFIDLIKR